MDYDPGPYSVTFMANHTSAPLNIMIINDTMLENDEMFNLIINSSSLHTPCSRVNISDPSLATVTIVNDDGNYYYTVIRPGQVDSQFIVTAHMDV